MIPSLPRSSALLFIFLQLPLLTSSAIDILFLLGRFPSILIPRLFLTNIHFSECVPSIFFLFLLLKFIASVLHLQDSGLSHFSICQSTSLSIFLQTHVSDASVLQRPLSFNSTFLIHTFPHSTLTSLPVAS